MPSPSDPQLILHHALITSDNAFQRRARLLQSLWREEQALPIGEHRGRPLGSRLAMPLARHELSNYLTDTITPVPWSDFLSTVLPGKGARASAASSHEGLLTASTPHPHGRGSYHRPHGRCSVRQSGACRPHASLHCAPGPRIDRMAFSPNAAQ